MNKLKSGIILEDRIFLPDYDNHSDMLKELNMVDDYISKTQNFVKFELCPVNGNIFTPIKDWIFAVNQNTTPEWFSADIEKYEQMARKKVEEWATTRIYIGVDGLDLSKGENFHLKDCKNIILRGAVCVNLYGNSQVNIMRSDSRISAMRDSSQVNIMLDISQVIGLWNTSQINIMRDNSQVRGLYNSSRVDIMLDNSRVSNLCNTSQINIMRDNSRVSDLRDTSQINIMRDNSAVVDLWDASQINVMRDNSWVVNKHDISSVGVVKDSAHYPNSLYDSPVAETTNKTGVKLNNPPFIGSFI